MTEASVKAKVLSLAYGGACIASIASGDPEKIGKKVFIKDVIPGELVRLKITAEQPRFAEGQLLEILEQSPARTEPPCRFYGECGGCDLQHIELTEQRKLKIAMLSSALQVQGVELPAAGVGDLNTDLPGFEYRRRIRLHCDLDGQIGFFKEGTGSVVPIDRCLLALPGINLVLSSLLPDSAEICRYFASFEIDQASNGVIFVSFNLREERSRDLKLAKAVIQSKVENFAIWQRKQVLYLQKAGTPSTDFSELESFGDFSQVNIFANQKLIDLVLSKIKQGPVDDLYAGAGNFALQLGKAGLNVRAIEVSKQLTEQGTKLARGMSLEKQVRFINSSCEQFVRKNKLAGTVLLDPPRSGAAEVCKSLEASTTRTLLYVSCSLPTFVRDSKTLAQKGLKLQEIYLLDMFPQTHHIEIIGLFAKS